MIASNELEEAVELPAVDGLLQLAAIKIDDLAREIKEVSLTPADTGGERNGRVDKRSSPMDNISNLADTPLSRYCPSVGARADDGRARAR